MATELGMRIVNTAQPVFDIVLPPRPTTVQRAGLLDVAPAAGLDLIVVGGVAAAVAVVLGLIVHRRRQK